MKSKPKNPVVIPGIKPRNPTKTKRATIRHKDKKRESKQNPEIPKEEE